MLFRSGRFELIDEGQPFTVVVDYAHTPDGLEKILTTAEEITKGRIIVVFGCGGDRDRMKRPIMGRIAARNADIALVTSDNPRTEDPASIVKEVAAGFECGISIDSYRDVKEGDQLEAFELKEEAAELK